LTPIPEEIIDESYTEEIYEDDAEEPKKILRKANTKHSAIIYIKVGQYELEEEIPIEVTSNQDVVSGEEVQTKTVIKLVDED